MTIVFPLVAANSQCTSIKIISNRPRRLRENKHSPNVEQSQLHRRDESQQQLSIVQTYIFFLTVEHEIYLLINLTGSRFVGWREKYRLTFEPRSRTLNFVTKKSSFQLSQPYLAEEVSPCFIFPARAKQSRKLGRSFPGHFLARTRHCDARIARMNTPEELSHTHLGVEP